jgi:cyclase
MRTLIALSLVVLTACAASPPPSSPPSPPAQASHPVSRATSQPAEAPSGATTVGSGSGSPAPSVTPKLSKEEEEIARTPLKVEKVSGSVYVLEGAGGNIGVSVGDDGIVLVDDQFAVLAPKIREALKGITDKPVRFVLNTHWHFDHTGGNAVFGSEAPILAHENVRKRLIAGASMNVGGKLLVIPPAKPEALPVVTFDDKVSVHLNGEDIRAIHVQSGHTDGDVIVHFVKSNVVHMGDDFVTTGFPFPDLDSGGTLRGMIGVIDKLAAELPADVKLIPGHGKVSGIEDLKRVSAVLKDCVKLVEAEMKKKKTLDQIKAAKVLAKYDDMGKGFMKTDMFIEIIFKELSRPAEGAKAPAAAKKPR